MTVDRSGLQRAPAIALGAVVAITGPLLLFRYGSYHWFLRDDWMLLTDRDGFPNLFEPHGGSHLIAVPRLVYLVLWHLFGVTTYRPYQVTVVLVHLAIGVLLYAVMRRAQVGAWLAVAAASMFLVVGPGAVNALWAFQVGFNGSLAWGLGHLLLADHDGPPDRRDALGLACGLLAIASSGVGVSVTAGVGLAVLLRRGWRMALLHTAPLAALHLTWVVLAGAKTVGPFGVPPFEILARWMRSSAIGVTLGLGAVAPLAYLLVAVLVVGLVLIARRFIADAPGRGELRARLAAPVGLAAAAVLFAATTGVGRAWVGTDFARGERYVYLEAALLLPLLAVAAEAVATRWHALRPVGVGLVLVIISYNLTHFDTNVFGESYMSHRQLILTSAVRVPFARDVPRDVEPIPDPFSGDGLNIGFLLGAERAGKLHPSTDPLTPSLVNELRVRLGVAQRPGPVPTDCHTYDAPVRLRPARGDVIDLGSPVVVATADGGRVTSPRVRFELGDNGTRLTVELPDLELLISRVPQARTFTLCGESLRVEPARHLAPHGSTSSP